MVTPPLVPPSSGENEPPTPQAPTADEPRRRHPLRWTLLSLLLVLLGAYAIESHTSLIQARVFAPIAQEVSFHMGPGPSPNLRFPVTGPYDQRLGHVRMPQFLHRLAAEDYPVEAQTRMSSRLLWELDRGLFPTYHEKTQTGLRILDRGGEALFDHPFPRRIYPDLASVPNIVAQTLLFIENRELLDDSQPYRNPAVEWDRLAGAVINRAHQMLDPEVDGAGGSTLATQMEKFRHSPDGRTRRPRDKLRQMVSASLRSYQDGPDTRAQRPRILLDYLNSVPLGAVPGFGEVIGLGDGLWAWYGADFAHTNALLAPIETRTIPTQEAATAYRQVLSLMLSQRRPSYYMGPGRAHLDRLTDGYLRVLAREGVIGLGMRDSALAQRPAIITHADANEPDFSVTPKAVNTVRLPLLSLLDAHSLYDLDRLDLDVTSTLDGEAQRAVTQTLKRLADRDFAREAGVLGFRLLGDEDLSKVVYSVTLYERGSDYHRLRVQTDNLDQPFDVNDGLKLDLGSTAKLRTYVHYLEIIAELHQRYESMSAHDLWKLPIAPQDHLTRFVVNYLARHKDRNLPDLLEAAKTRTYSASPREAFFTGDGRHTFANFDKADNGRVVSVRDALRRSVNLVFIRLMRDIVRYHIYQRPGARDLLENEDAPERQTYLARFANQEGSVYLRRFYAQYHEGSVDPATRLLDSLRAVPTRHAAVLRYLEPKATPEQFAERLRTHLDKAKLSDKKVQSLFERYGPDRYDLTDRGYLAHVHPLELWLAAYLIQHPRATLAECLDASKAERQIAYRWLFRTGSKRAQDRRIRSMLEKEAFVEIHKAWHRLGYPFDHLVPSYATAIGSSGDRPAALAELMGIILDDGMRRPLVRVERLHFARDTPYETVVQRAPAKGEQVLAPEVAAAVRDNLYQVVEHGTAIRARNAILGPSGEPLRIGGKTGTGDHRREIYGRDGHLIESRAMNRAATFVFLIGDRYFGNVTAYVPGGEAENYKFTSSLPVQVLKVLGEDLEEMMARSDKRAAPSSPVAP